MVKKEKSFKEYLAKIESPDYPWVAKGCPENPTALEKMKYDTCQSILSYKLTNHLTTQQIAKKIRLNKDETQKLLFCWIENFSLDDLVAYADKLLGPSQISINIKGITERKSKKAVIHA